ncbi:hypothetical protein HY251_18995 [bacterium]|nr:hypothetical protein [bacterium]
MRTRSVVAPVLSLALACVPLALALGEDAKEPDMDDLAGLETLAVKVEVEGVMKDELKRLREDLSLDLLKELPKPEGLVFPVKATIKSDAEFTRKYYEQYDSVFERLSRTVHQLAKENNLWKDPAPPKGKAAPPDDDLQWVKDFLKKYPAGKKAPNKKSSALEELHAILMRLPERWEKARAHAKELAAKKPDKDWNGKSLEKELDARADKAKAFMKQYDFGPQIAKQRLEGSAKLYFDLTKDAYDYVKSSLGILNAKQLMDPKGKLIRWRSKQVFGAPRSKLKALGVNKTLSDNLSEHEFFVIQYALADNSIGEEAREKALIRLTGAQLLTGLYYFIEAEDRIIVYVPDAPE